MVYYQWLFTAACRGHVLKDRGPAAVDTHYLSMWSKATHKNKVKTKKTESTLHAAQQYIAVCDCSQHWTTNKKFMPTLHTNNV